MEIYLDANATTAVLPQARAAALAAMSENFGNPSSIHGKGLQARAVLDGARARARRVLGAPAGRLTFTSGATEGIQTAVLSALASLRQRREAGQAIPTQLLYGATEHKAVPVALNHWNTLLGLALWVRAIPVDGRGRHDLDWLRQHARDAGLVCTMAANNETGVISDLDGIECALAGSRALWMVDAVQALGKLELALGERAIDYAPFSGHKLYAPKGVGLLYVREGAPFTPLMTGGGQEGDLRAGTENTAGIAAFGAVLEALEERDGFRDRVTLASYREDLAQALQEAFPGLVFNADPAISLPTTLNFSVPGVPSKVLLDVFDAAGLRVSGGSACSASKSRPSDVLEAMGLAAWRTGNAVRMSFGPREEPGVIAEACRGIRSCGAALRGCCMFDVADAHAAAPRLITRYVVDGACCYLVCPPESRQCVVIDPLPELTGNIARLLACQNRRLVAVLDTHSHGDHASSADGLWAAVGNAGTKPAMTDSLGWPAGVTTLELDAYSLSRLATPGHTLDACAFVLRLSSTIVAAFVGDTVMPGALGRTDFAQSLPQAFAGTLRLLQSELGADALLLPGHDYDDRHATTLAVERRAQPLVAAALDQALSDDAFVEAKAGLEQGLAQTQYQTMACGARVDACTRQDDVELSNAALDRLLADCPQACLVDVREGYEQRVDDDHVFPADSTLSVPLSTMVNAIPDWLNLAPNKPIVFICRSGNRSAQAARALRRLGNHDVFSLAGGLALRELALGNTDLQPA